MMGFWDAVASAGPYANNLHLAQDRKPHQHLIIHFFIGQMLLLTPNQQCQGTESLDRKFIMKSSLTITPNLKHVATLPHQYFTSF